MKVCVTGHQGYIGSILVQVLQRDGHQVSGLDTKYYEGCNFSFTPNDLPTIRKDIRDIEPGDLAGFDAVVHLAALSNDPLGDLKPEWTYEINHQASVKLALAAKQAGVSLYLFSSSCSLYGATRDELVKEDAPLRPLTPYAISKARTEEDLLKIADSGFFPVFLRNATAYGVSPFLRLDIVLNNLVAWAYCTGKVLITSDGTPWRPLIHVEDISIAFSEILKVPREVVNCQAINIGVPGENYQVRQLAEIVRETIPECSVEFAGRGGPDPRDYRVDFSKLARLIPNFHPRWNARLGAQELFRAFQAVKLNREELQGRNFIRLGQLKYLLSEGRLDATLRWKN